jgi:hypothetical protein
LIVVFKYYTSKATTECYTTPYAASSYYTTAPKYYSAPNPSTSPRSWSTTIASYVAPAHQTGAPIYYTPKATEYYTTACAAPTYYIETDRDSSTTLLQLLHRGSNLLKLEKRKNLLLCPHPQQRQPAKDKIHTRRSRRSLRRTCYAAV